MKGGLIHIASWDLPSDTHADHPAASTSTLVTQSVGYSLTPALSSKAPARMRTAVMSFDQEAFIAESKEMRLKHLEEQVSARVSWEWEQGRWL